MTPQVLYVSATPADYELQRCEGIVVEQVIRPTGLLDPLIRVRPTTGQVDNLLEEIQLRVETERTFAWLASVKVTRIIFYARAVSKLLYHFHVVGGALVKALCFQFLAFAAEKFHAFAKVELNLRYGRSLACGRSHEYIGGIDFEPVMAAERYVVEVPQIRAMYGGDRSRKENLVQYGFRLPAALDNRPLKFEEFESMTPQVLYVSATPADSGRSSPSRRRLTPMSTS